MASIVQGQTPLNTVSKWALQLAGHTETGHTIYSTSLTEALAYEGWAVGDITRTCTIIYMKAAEKYGHLAVKSDDLPHLLFIQKRFKIEWDILMGYVRGGHGDKFRALWVTLDNPFIRDGQLLIPPPPSLELNGWRRYGMFESQLYRAAADANQSEILFVHIPSHSISLGKQRRKMKKDDWLSVITKTLIKRGQYDLLVQFHNTIPTAREWLDKHNKDEQFVQYLILKMDVFDHRIVEMLKPSPGWLDRKFRRPIPKSEWNKTAWDRGRLEDLQWLRSNGLLRVESFRDNVLRPTFRILQHPTPPNYPRFEFQKNAHQHEYTLAEQYLVSSPCTTWLMEQGYYSFLFEMADQSNSVVNKAWTKLRPDMRSWLESNGMNVQIGV